MIRALSSIVASLRASARLGRASRLRDTGRREEALVVAHDGLRILRGRAVNRTRPLVASAISCLTIVVEDLATELHSPGAEKTDILDTLTYLKGLPKPPLNVEDMTAWIPYLESKVIDRAV
jgi:hypothetical protein